MIYQKIEFEAAKPIWEKGTETVMNRSLLFCAQLPGTKNAVLRIAGHTSYRIFLNGAFIWLGPARAGQGFYRVDEIPLGAYLTKETNLLTVISTGYNCSSYYTFNEPSFLCAEVVADGCVLCATGVDGWEAYGYDNRLRKTQRYTFQRTFSEVYDFCNIPGAVYSPDGHVKVEVASVAERNWIARGISPSVFEWEYAEGIVESGAVVRMPWDENAHVQTIVREAGITMSGYPMDELEYRSVMEANRLILTKNDDTARMLPVSVKAGEYVMAKMQGNRSGLISLELSCLEDTELFLTFDEILSDGKINYVRGCSNVVVYHLKGGEHYSLLTAEPYTYQYLNVTVPKGNIQIQQIGMVRIGFNRREIRCALNERADDTIARIYHAAIESFCQNTFDVYMDCASRERAGWLCDSFFTSRVERLLSGESRVEHNFLANFVMATEFPYLPKGAIPMCYPADHDNGNYIPNWMMWYALELKEYWERTGDRAFVEDAKDLVYGVLEFLRGFENPDGLLERLEGWVFVEWSKSNSFVQDINYPSNMLYCMFKQTVGELYGDKSLLGEAEALRLTIREKSRYGLFFCDNSVYGDDGIARLSGECTESCQYYAFFTGVASAEEDPELWRTLVEDFGPERKETGKWKEIYLANAFVGNYLRLELLSKAGYHDKLEENIRGYFDYMAIRTDTLWEHDSVKASCNHGFASHVLVWLNVLGYLKN